MYNCKENGRYNNKVVEAIDAKELLWWYQVGFWVKGQSYSDVLEIFIHTNLLRTKFINKYSF